jgi:hypothetical protein
MTRLLLFVALTVVVAGGCKKYRSNSDDTSNPPSGGGGGGSGGAPQAVRGAVQRVVVENDLHQLHLFMVNAKASLGHVPTSQETLAELSKPDGSRELVQLIQSGALILVPNPGEEGLWAYVKEAPTQGGWVLTHSEPRRVTPQEFAALQRGN